MDIYGLLSLLVLVITMSVFLGWIFYYILKSVIQHPRTIEFLRLLTTATLWGLIIIAGIGIGWLLITLFQILALTILATAALILIYGSGGLLFIIGIGFLLLLFRSMQPRLTVHEIRISDGFEDDPPPAFYRIGRVKYPDVHVEITYLTDGTNLKMILRHAKEAASRAGLGFQTTSKYVREATNGDYIHTIQTTVNWFNVDIA